MCTHVRSSQCTDIANLSHTALPVFFKVSRKMTSSEISGPLSWSSPLSSGVLDNPQSFMAAKREPCAGSHRHLAAKKNERAPEGATTLGS